HHGLREIRKAAKKTKAFEIQKLVKKLKELGRKGAGEKEIVDYEAQLDILKNIDHEIFANTATRSKITKDRVLSQHEQIQGALSQALGDKILPRSVPEGSAAKVHSRLLSSKILATEISSLCDDLREFLGHEPKKSRFETDGKIRLDVQISEDSTSHNPGILKESHMATEPDMDSEEENLIDEAGWESGTVDEEEHHSDGDGWDLQPQSSGEEELDDLGQEDDSTSANRHHQKSARSEAPTKVPLSAAKQSDAISTFLPSLSVGFVRGSDDSDWSDNEAKVADSGKKNRRGQRARRAIWEKKYGKNANHKKKELEIRGRHSREGLDQGRRDGSHRDSQRFTKTKITTDGGTRLKKVEWGPGSSQRAGSHPPLNAQSKEKHLHSHLHPSWEAKRKLKEKQSVGIVASQGTKIKFSD
ncbi:BUD22 family protein C4F10.06, partial [Leucoagaricus sp. SymC.cos]